MMSSRPTMEHARIERPLAVVLVVALLVCAIDSAVVAEDTFAPLMNGKAPQTFHAMWGDFDPRAEPLETEVLEQWEEDGVMLRVVRFRIGVFKGETASLAGVYGFPKDGTKLPGLLQIHGGGQYADANACIQNAKRGYATLSIAWAGRISSSKYRVNPEGVRLFWDGKIDDPNYRVTTDWGVVDGYHAPSRNPGNQFPSVKAAAWTLDPVESPRNSGWFLCAVAARRGLTFLEQQSEVDPNRLGVYGHSMGGKLTVLTSTDSRVKAAAPSCGGVSDRHNDSELFRNTLGDDVSLKELRCPIIFLSPANDFHGRIVDLPDTINEIPAEQWRVTCSPHHNHQDTAPFEAATVLWFDQHLRNSFSMPSTPQSSLQLEPGENPQLVFTIDDSQPVLSVDVYYTQDAMPNETPADRELSVTRFWHHVKPIQDAKPSQVAGRWVAGRWVAELPISSSNQPILVYANVAYGLVEPVSGAGYYYRTYTTESFNVSSLVSIAWADEVSASGVVSTLKPTRWIEDFGEDWEKEWFTYRPEQWSRTTHKLHDSKYDAPGDAELLLEVISAEPNQLVVLMDDHAAVVSLVGGEESQQVILSRSDFRNYDEAVLRDWKSVKRLKLSPAEHLKPVRNQPGKPRVIGKHWTGDPPRFVGLRWVTKND